MKIVGRALVAAGAVVVLAVGFPLSAQAASGTFIYHTAYGQVAHSLVNPQDEQCYTLGRAGGPTNNGTNRDAELYSARACSGDVVGEIHAGESDEYTEFVSVKFVR